MSPQSNSAILDTNALRNHLLSVALPYAESLRNRPGLVGILLYGSLVRGSLTAFSDIDMAIFYEDSPVCRIEHRVVDHIKVDLIAFPLTDVTKLLHPIPSSLDVGFPFSYVLESLLLGDSESILYDPSGELRRVKTRLDEQTSFPALKLASCSNGYHQYYRTGRDKAGKLLEQGDFLGALDQAQWSGWALTHLLREFTTLKDTREAAERLEILDFAGRSEELAAILAPSHEDSEAVWAATQALWEYSLQAAAAPVREHLRAQGVSEPDGLELIGNYDLFWPGDRLHEFGRVIGEVDLSLRWCRSDLDRGKGAAALKRLWACQGQQIIRHRWECLAAALTATGYDCSAIIEAMLNGTEFTRLGKRLDEAVQASQRKDATAEMAHHTLELTDDMEQLLLKVIPIDREAKEINYA